MTLRHPRVPGEVFLYINDLSAKDGLVWEVSYLSAAGRTVVRQVRDVVTLCVMRTRCWKGSHKQPRAVLWARAARVRIYNDVALIGSAE